MGGSNKLIWQSARTPPNPPRPPRLAGDAVRGGGNTQRPVLHQPRGGPRLAGGSAGPLHRSAAGAGTAAATGGSRGWQQSRLHLPLPVRLPGRLADAAGRRRGRPRRLMGHKAGRRPRQVVLHGSLGFEWLLCKHCKQARVGGWYREATFLPSQPPWNSRPDCMGVSAKHGGRHHPQRSCPSRPLPASSLLRSPCGTSACRHIVKPKAMQHAALRSSHVG